MVVDGFTAAAAWGAAAGATWSHDTCQGQHMMVVRCRIHKKGLSGIMYIPWQGATWDYNMVGNDSCCAEVHCLQLACALQVAMPVLPW